MDARWTGADDARSEDDSSASDSAPAAPAVYHDLEEWCDYMHGVLWDLWDSMRQYAARYGYRILDACTFHQFCAEAHRLSTKTVPPPF